MLTTTASKAKFKSPASVSAAVGVTTRARRPRAKNQLSLHPVSTWSPKISLRAHTLAHLLKHTVANTHLQAYIYTPSHPHIHGYTCMCSESGPTKPCLRKAGLKGMSMVWARKGHSCLVPHSMAISKSLSICPKLILLAKTLCTS